MVTISGFLAILSLIGVAQGLLLASALISVKRGNNTANRLLASLVLVVSIFVLGAVVRTTNYDWIVPHLSRLHDPFTFLAGPLLFLYIRTIVSERTAISKKDFLHFIPFGVFVIYLMPFYFQSAENKYRVLLVEFQQTGMGEYYYVRSILVIVHFLIYLFLSIWIIAALWRDPEGKSKPINRNALLQTRFLIAASIVILILSVLRYALDHTAQTNLLIPLIVAATVYGLGYICLIKPEVVIGIEEPQPLQPPAPKYEKSTLTPERSERYLKKLLDLMETEKPYLKGELTLQELAGQLSIPAQHLSQIINERLKQSFSDFINVYRIEEVKKLLLDPKKKHYSILALAEESGFNSKSSFNAVFKKHVNMTPSEFRNSQNGAERY
ncbi:MAG: helix-turn-helix transcriptional regulator [Acidobacteriota bacterium]|nr:helix-turn-helix transcriptional regulator [Acidobacteriota bacterium]